MEISLKYLIKGPSYVLEIRSRKLTLPRNGFLISIRMIVLKVKNGKEFCYKIVSCLLENT